MGRCAVTVERLRAAGAAAEKAALIKMREKLNAESIPDGVVKCEYVGTEEEDAPLRSLTRVVYRWTVGGGSTTQSMYATKAIRNQKQSSLRRPGGGASRERRERVAGIS